MSSSFNIRFKWHWPSNFFTLFYFHQNLTSKSTKSRILHELGAKLLLKRRFINLPNFWILASYIILIITPLFLYIITSLSFPSEASSAFMSYWGCLTSDLLKKVSIVSCYKAIITTFSSKSRTFKAFFMKRFI